MTVKGGLWMCGVVLLPLLLAAADASNIKSDERVLFFPTLGRFLPGEDAWEIEIHAWVFEPESDSLKRAAALGALRRMLGLPDDAADTAVFKERARAFLVDSEGGKRLVVRLAGATYRLPDSEANGHVAARIRVPASAIRRSGGTAASGDSGMTIEAVLPEGDGRRMTGSVLFLDARGVSVISDIDDTIKVSQVTDKKALLTNTFIREFKAVPGMAAAYRALADGGASFHYVTASPWQLYEPLAGFMSVSGFPAGTFHMKLFRMKDSSLLNLFASPEESKPAAIEPILRAGPDRRVILVGDAGEKDPEIYGGIARRFPGQIVHVFIRNFAAGGNSSRRFAMAFAGVPKDRWTVFSDPQVVLGLIREKWLTTRPLATRPGGGL